MRKHRVPQQNNMNNNSTIILPTNFISNSSGFWKGFVTIEWARGI